VHVHVAQPLDRKLDALFILGHRGRGDRKRRRVDLGTPVRLVVAVGVRDRLVRRRISRRRRVDPLSELRPEAVGDRPQRCISNGVWPVHAGRLRRWPCSARESPPRIVSPSASEPLGSQSTRRLRCGGANLPSGSSGRSSPRGPRRVGRLATRSSDASVRPSAAIRSSRSGVLPVASCSGRRTRAAVFPTLDTLLPKWLRPRRRLAAAERPNGFVAAERHSPATRCHDLPSSR